MQPKCQRRPQNALRCGQPGPRQLNPKLCANLRAGESLVLQPAAIELDLLEDVRLAALRLHLAAQLAEVAHVVSDVAMHLLWQGTNRKIGLLMLLGQVDLEPFPKK